ncbi:BRD4-interacting chromatin-remodeling complex-associated protein-like isoform X1 [Carassius auratus]|uniref:BRD4-interacting chromatin-remodeling complex-associated protein-like isoform X1 n=1 Tax=Carassius auratus TaxID=7957 RepID=A0A6P6R7D0_CARAU|nr:BRD4-interacting chromatin-remodeling complex-associated protein-like isoform X1 [Carassius auratus]
MEDEDGICLFDVLCDPQALNDFLHGTNELPSGDLLIDLSSGEPSLFTDTPSPASLLADDACSQDTPVSCCVDLSFLEEALLASPGSSLGSGGPEVQEDPNVQLVEQQKEPEEICDFLQQSLQEPEITEDTLPLETAETIQFGLSGTSIPLPSTPYFSKPLTLPGLNSLPKGTQPAVEPPQPSLLAVGLGCPSLKPPGTQLISLLPGNVFPAPPLEASFSLDSAQRTSMIIQKTLPAHHMLASTVRTITPSGVMLQKKPLPIQPKLPVSIQPRLVQISPRPPGQKPLPGFTFISTKTSQSVLLSPSVNLKHSLQAQTATSVSKPVSSNLVGQRGPIVIQPQDPIQAKTQFILPSQTPATLSKSASIPRCILSTPSNQVSNKPSVDNSHIVTVRSNQINFSPILTSASGQLTLKQGALLSGSLPIRSTPPTVFQMPTQLAGTNAPQVQGQHDAVVQNTDGNQITLINNANILIPDLTTVPIENGQSMIQSVPLVPQAQSARISEPEGKACLTQNSVLLLPERTTEAQQEKINKPFQESGLLPPTSVEAPVAEIHPLSSPVSTLLQSSPDISFNPKTVLSLSPQLINQTGEHNPLNRNQALVHPSQQFPQKPSASQDLLAATLLVQMDNHISASVGEAEDSLSSLTASETFSSLCESEQILMPTCHDSEHTDILLQSPIGQRSVKTTDTDSMKGSTTPVSDEQDSSVLIALGADPECQGGPVMNKSHSSSLEKLFMCLEQLGQSHVLTELSRTSTESTDHEYKQQYGEHDTELTVPRSTGIISFSQRELQEKVNLGPRLLAQDRETYSTFQKNQIPSAGVDPKEEKLRLTKRQHRFKQQLFLDHSAVLNPNTSAPFVSVEDALRHLLPYHSCARALPNQADFISVDKQFECVSVVLLKRFKDMLNKYRKQLLTESQQESPSAEMVMLERLFLQSETLSLMEDRRKTRRDPAESFLMTRSKYSSQHTHVPSIQTGLGGCPPSPPSWTLQSDRPPGLKTYSSSSKGTIGLTIRQESGSPKVIHNSCDASHVISGLKRNYSGQLTKGGAIQGKNESLKPPLLNVAEDKNGQRPDQPNKMKLHPDMETISTGSDSQSLSDSVVTQDSRVQGLLPEQCTPVFKRNKLTASVAESHSLPAFVEDGELSEHLQSALDSILELQRLQGSVAGVKPKIQQPRALDQAISSMLEGQL